MATIGRHALEIVGFTATALPVGAGLVQSKTMVSLVDYVNRQAPAQTCFLSAILNGESLAFQTAREKFEALANSWLDHQAGKSRIDLAHPAFLQIVGMGKDAVPFLLEEVEQQSGHWFSALKYIVGDTPVPPESKSDFDAVTAKWLEWGELNGYYQKENGSGELVAD